MAMMNPSQMGSPIPDGERLFTEDKSNIMRDTNGSLVVEMVQTPKTIVAGQPATFVMNLFATNGTWLWHSDFDVSLVNNNTGEKVLVMPNIHGHGSMAQFSYAFPSQGTYNINITFGQQVNSPNYIKPHDVRTAQFIVNVGEGQTNTNTVTNETNATTQSEIKEIPVNVFSWGFEPNKIEVNKGDLVRLDFKTNNDEVSLYNGHGFGIEGYSINVFLIKGTNQTVEFEADKPGTFTFRCTSFCALPDAPESVHFDMTGTLVVNE
jgi:heme/copper-type cytochrome/quinol oxidase subunit 2